MRKFKLFSYLLITGMLFSNANMYAMDEQSQNLGNEENQIQGEFIKVADPTYDVAFKPLMRYIFGNDTEAEPEIRKYGITMLNDLLHDDLKELGLKIISVEFDTDTITKATPNEEAAKTINSVEFDVRLKCGCQKCDPLTWKEDVSSNAIKNENQCATSIIIEMQRKRETFFIDRSYSYEAFNKVANSKHAKTSQNDGNEEDKKDNKKGNKVRYGDVAATFVVSLLNYTLTGFENCGAAFGFATTTRPLFGEKNTTPKIFTTKGSPHIYFLQLPKIYKNIKDGKYEGPISIKQFLEVMTLREASKDRSQTNVQAEGRHGINVNKNYYERNQSEPILPLLVEKLRTLYDNDYIEEVNVTVNAEQEVDRIVKENKEQGRQEGLEQGRQEGLEQGLEQGTQKTLKNSIDSAYNMIVAYGGNIGLFYNFISPIVSDNPDYKSFIIEYAKSKYPNWNDVKYEEAAKKLKLSSQEQQGSGSIPTSTK